MERSSQLEIVEYSSQNCLYEQSTIIILNLNIEGGTGLFLITSCILLTWMNGSMQEKTVLTGTCRHSFTIGG